jgi:hypothetical protein
MQGIKISKNDEEQIIQKYIENNNISKTKLAKLFNINRSSVINILKRKFKKIYNESEERIYTEQEVKDFFKKHNCQLLSKFETTNIPLKYKCICGNISFIRFNSFKNGTRCRNCVKEKFKIPQEKVFNFINSLGYQILSNKYHNSNKPLEIVCPVGHKINMTYSSLKLGCRCRICNFINRRGENHPR